MSIVKTGPFRGTLHFYPAASIRYSGRKRGGGHHQPNISAVFLRLLGRDKNKGSIIHHALASGRLDYVARVVAAFEGEDGFIPLLNREIDRLRSSQETEAADALDKNKGSIINHALHQGSLDYVARVIATFEGEDGFIPLLNREIDRLRSSQETEAADALDKNKGSIIYHALSSGRLDYLTRVVAAFEGEDGFIPLLNREIDRLRSSQETEAADALGKNKGSIINHAFASGRLDYVARVVAAFEGEDGFLVRLDRAVKGLRRRGKTDLADPLRERRGSIVNDAIRSGDFGPADDEAFVAWVLGRV